MPPRRSLDASDKRLGMSCGKGLDASERMRALRRPAFEIKEILNELPLQQNADQPAEQTAGEKSAVAAAAAADETVDAANRTPNNHDAIPTMAQQETKGPDGAEAIPRTQERQNGLTAAERFAAMRARIAAKEGKVSCPESRMGTEARAETSKSANPANSQVKVREEPPTLAVGNWRKRRVMILKRHIEKFGETRRCAGCKAAVGNLPQREHTEVCRARLEREIANE